MNSINKIEFTLMQHTPLVHFQYEQEDATLRASEVKPKLDRFLISFLKKNKIDYSKWLLKTTTFEALDYKLSFHPIDQSIEHIDSSPLYFGNMGDAPAKHFSYTGKLHATIFSYNIELITSINEKLICEFFFKNNFSTRQTKGFGCFYPTKFNGNIVNTIPGDFVDESQFRLEIDTTNDVIIFDTIDYFWKWLKSGVNYNNLYLDSILKLFISENTNYKWEKKKVKEYFLGVDPDNDSKLFVRAFLGLADNFTYKWVPKSKRKDGKSYSPVDFTISVKCEDTSIQRAPSPIVFVAFKSGGKTIIYLCVNNKIWDENLLRKRFRLSVSKKIDPIKFREIRQTIYPDTQKDHALRIIDNAKDFLDTINDNRAYKKMKDTIEKAEDYISFFSSPEKRRLNEEHVIECPTTIPLDINLFLKYAHSKMKSNFQVKNFKNELVTTAKFLSNEK